jgi:hypothetical protein
MINHKISDSRNAVLWSGGMRTRIMPRVFSLEHGPKPRQITGQMFSSLGFCRGTVETYHPMENLKDDLADGNAYRLGSVIIYRCKFNHV